jgi:hypothetical protein
MSDMTCAQLDELGAELALGVLPAFERAMAQAHLAGCARCREQVRQLTVVGDELLDLVPESEPPVGLESHVMRRLLPVPIRARRRWPRIALAAACAALFAVGGWVVSATTRTAPAEVVTVAMTTPNHGAAGTMFVYTGQPGWLYMNVDVDTGNEWVTCEVQRRDGTVVADGRFQLHGGYGFWGAPLPATVTNLAEARLVTSDGRTVATATFG